MISVSIMGVPERFTSIIEIKRKLLYPCTVSIDHNHKGPLYNSIQCWKACTGTHHLVIQDDIHLCRNFIPAVKQIITLIPQNPLSFYMWGTGSKRYLRLMGKKSWMGMDTPRTAQALLLPKSIIAEYLDWIPKHVDPRCRLWDDGILGAFLSQHHIPILQSIPCLVTHRQEQSVISSHIHASPIPDKTWIGTRDPLKIDWTLGIDEAIKHPYHFGVFTEVKKFLR